MVEEKEVKENEIIFPRIKRRLVNPKEKEERRQHILSVATMLLIEGGYSEVKIRDIAKALDTSASSIYSYYESKEAILQAIVEQELESLEMVLSDVKLSQNLFDSLKTICVTYYNHAVQNPFIYKLIFPSSYENVISTTAPLQLFSIFNGYVFSAFKSFKSRYTKDKIKTLSQHLWALTHGSISLAEDILQNTENSLTIERLVDIFFVGWKKSVKTS